MKDGDNESRRERWTRFRFSVIGPLLRRHPASASCAQSWRCCTALAESEIRLWWWPRYVSSMKYPKRCQYKHAKQKKYPRSQLGGIQRRAAPPGRFDSLV